MRRICLLVVLILTGLTTACTTPTPTSLPRADLTFIAELSMINGRELLLDLSARNDGPVAAPDDDFEAVWQLRDAQDDLRAQGKAFDLPALDAGEHAGFMLWQGIIEPGTYTLTWGAPGYGSTSLRFEVFETEFGRELRLLDAPQQARPGS